MLVLLLLLESGCGIPPEKDSAKQDHSHTTLKQGFALLQQHPPPRNIQNIQLYPVGQTDSPPVITLKPEERLKLSFDLLAKQNQQFRVEVSHRTQDWEESRISPSTYLNSFSHAYIQHSEQSLSTHPVYQHVSYIFPNNQLRPIKSGNYLLNIYEYQGGNLLFSLPFFITENKGNLQTRIETLFAKRNDGRSLAQLFSSYRYPDMVEYPQFDLSISYVQDRFWGRTKKAGYLDTATPYKLNGYLSRDEAFIANYEFKHLDLRTFEADQRQIRDFYPNTTPPEVILRRDIQNLDNNTASFSATKPDVSIKDRGGRYADVQFSFETNNSVPLSSELYIVGDFNHWMINMQNKMTYHDDEKIWKGRALIKQGEYAYKYILVRNGAVDDLALDQGFLSAQQEYLTFIYFNDPRQHYDRLLKVGRLVSN